jgi:polygalacturonase
VSGIFGASGRGGVAVDQYGNVVVADDVDAVVHMIDANTGTMTVVAGAGTACSGKQSSAGDGCLAATQTTLSHPRGIGLDAYGNVLIPDYGSNLIHIVCRFASPICTTSTPAPTASNPIQVQVGNMGLVAGCTSATGSSGTNGVGFDGAPAFSTSSNVVTAFKNGGTCSASFGNVDSPRAAWGDIYGNIYYADTSSSRTRAILGPYTSSYFSGANPLYAALGVNTNWTWTGAVSTSTLKPGYVYTVANVEGNSTSTSTPTVSAGSACLTSITAPAADNSLVYQNASIASTALDTHADGCPFFDSAVYANSGVTDTANVDGAGNLIFTDPGAGGLLRVFFIQGWASANAVPTGIGGSVASAGVAMYNAIVKNNSAITPAPGYIYALAGGDTNFTGGSSATYPITVLALGIPTTSTALTVANTSSTYGMAITGTVSVAPTAANGAATIYLDGAAATACALSGASCSWTLSNVAVGAHTMYAAYSGNGSYGASYSATITINVAAATATGDTRTVTEPSFPAVCQQLAAVLTTDPSIQDLDSSTDSTVTNLDGARIQQALNNCSGSDKAVELSMDSTGTYNAYLTGPLTIPAHVTLLVDPNVTVFFSRNVQDYDKVPGTHTCGTISGNSNTGSCNPLIHIPGASSNVGIMGYGKLNARGGDALINAFQTTGYPFPPTATWWNLANGASTGSQQNPRFIQVDSPVNNLTLYKITIMNSPNFHVAISGPVTNFTAWGVKIVTPTSARNTDGIDPGRVANGTITQSWISDGDDNVAAGAGSGRPGQNISVTYNHFLAGHGESIGSGAYGGVSNLLFDHNMLAGNAVSGHGSAQWGLATDGNSTAIRIKTAADRGGTVSNIQYSNSCILDHQADIQFTPYYDSTDGTESPNYTNILLQNLVFLNDAGKSGTVELDGYYNSNGDVSGGSAITNPLNIIMDNVTFPSSLSSLVSSTLPYETTSVWNYGGFSGGQGQYVNLTAGPGQVLTNFLTAYNTLAAVPSNHDTLTDNISQTTLDPPNCVFTYIAPELTGGNGVSQSISYGNALCNPYSGCRRCPLPDRDSYCERHRNR